MARKSFLLLAAVFVVLGVGCGGGSESSETAGGESTARGGSTDTTTASKPEGTALGKAAYLKNVNRMCAEALKRTQEGAADGLRAGETSEIAAMSAAIGPAFGEAIDEIEALEGPSASEAQIEKFAAALQQGLETVERKQSSISSYAELEQPLEQAGDLAKAYGISNCAFGG